MRVLPMPIKSFLLCNIMYTISEPRPSAILNHGGQNSGVKFAPVEGLRTRLAISIPWLSVPFWKVFRIQFLCSIVYFLTPYNFIQMYCSSCQVHVWSSTNQIFVPSIFWSADTSTASHLAANFFNLVLSCAMEPCMPMLQTWHKYAILSTNKY